MIHKHKPCKLLRIIHAGLAWACTIGMQGVWDIWQLTIYNLRKDVMTLEWCIDLHNRMIAISDTLLNYQSGYLSTEGVQVYARKSEQQEKVMSDSLANLKATHTQY